MYSGYSSGGSARQKVRVNVEIVTGDTTMAGFVFLNHGERIIDMMNDARQYVAFEHGDGTFEVISKQLIRRIRPLDQSRPDSMRALPIMPGT